MFSQAFLEAIQRNPDILLHLGLLGMVAGCVLACGLGACAEMILAYRPRRRRYRNRNRTRRYFR